LRAELGRNSDTSDAVLAEADFTLGEFHRRRPSNAVLGSITVSDSNSASALTKAYAQLLSLAVHEFRTPATVVNGYLRMLQKDVQPPLEQRQKKMVDEAAKSFARILEVLAEMGDISKLDSGDAALRNEPFDLFAVVGEVATTVHESEDRGVRLQVQGESAGAPLTADLTRFRTAIAAFLRAILREQPSDAVVVVDRRIVRERAATSAIVTIAGKNAVQQSYETARGPLEEKRGGLGLSLSIGRRVVEHCGGHVWSPSGDEKMPLTELEQIRKSAIVVSVPVRELNR
jgi:signal transduction histidine kinase